MLRAGSKTTTYEYSYDALGNITSIDKDGMLRSLYIYDSLNRLVQEYDAEARVTYAYTYDNAGNILTKSKNGTETAYTYSTSAWGDLLTNYDGTSISYDALGNPLNWRNAYSLAWDGRQLQSFTSFNEDVVNYTYNADEIRVFKNYFDRVNPTIYTHSYVVDGTNIVSETVTNSHIGESYKLYYFYDEKGDIVGFKYNGNAYFYQKNIQGDILCICDRYGNIVAEYTYDSWGKVLSVTDANGNAITSDTHVANLNPFRYRSYYYDTETGFYYLNSRYYDPEVGRFLNADGIIGANGGIDGYNLFAYCNNNPVMHSDPSGECFGYLITAAKLVAEKVKTALKKIEPIYSMLSMKPSEEVMALIEDYETFTENKKNEGRYSVIGYGHSVYHNDMNDPYINRSSITREEAHALALADATALGNKVIKYAIERKIILTQCQYDAYVCYAYNVGPSRVPDVMDLILSETDVLTAFTYRLDYQDGKVKLGLFRRWDDSADIYLNGNYGRDYPALYDLP